jgi:threonyl-tRNA synthetase
MIIRVPGGQELEYGGGGNLKEALVALDRSLLKTFVAARCSGETVDFHVSLPAEAEVELLPWDGPEAPAVFRHSLSHVMAQAVRRLFPEAQLAIGPAIEDGFYYDFDVERAFTPEDLARIEQEMGRICKENLRFERLELPRAEALGMLAEAPYKREIVEDLAGEETLSFYRDGDFVDLCRGPHVLSTGQVRHFKLLSTAGAYWRGDESRKMLQRIYGTAFASREALDRHLQMLEEARKRDHRILGRQLQLFHIDEEVGQGLVLWTPRGAVVRQELQTFIAAELRRQGYAQVFTPHIGKLDLYRTSGHFPYYQESQYPPLIEHEHLTRLAAEGCSCADLANRMREGTIDGYLLKPMNCPHHVKIFASQPRSYRDLPVRLAEFGTVYRWEQSGEIGGMTRVRGFTQDDAHLFCTEEQVPAELLGCLELVKIIFTTLGMKDYRVRVGLRDPDSQKYVGAPAQWDRAEAACREAARSLGVLFSEEAGEAAFYGPKIDFIVRDVLGREWQLGTVQVDYNLPERFDLGYTGQDGQAHRPVMIHRAPFGSLERFVGVLIEHFAGAFPVWLAPVQAVVLPIAERHAEYAVQVHRQLVQAGVRAELDDANQTLNYRIRQAQVMKVPYMLVAGDREAAAGQVALRQRSGEGQEPRPVNEVVSLIAERIATKALD